MVGAEPEKEMKKSKSKDNPEDFDELCEARVSQNFARFSTLTLIQDCVYLKPEGMILSLCLWY